MTAIAAALLAFTVAPHAAGPFQQDSMGPIRNVTAHWRSYQPANVFCVKPDVNEYTPRGVGPTVSARNRACRHSGFRRSVNGLVVIRVRTPTLCPGCRRLFIDFSKIPRVDAPPQHYARGHSFYRLASPNFTYTVDPLDHSPNTKNFTNDKLLAPSGSPQERVIGAMDLHQMFGYVTDTTHFVHTQIQGPYYVGPWYVNRNGRRIHGVYLDVDVKDASEYPGGAQSNEIGYVDGFNSGQVCSRGDDDSFYGGCVDWWGFSTSTVNPYAPIR